MKDLDEELWGLGVHAKTEHNEAAPAQHELAPIFNTTNIATDHNQITMETMQKCAKNHGMVCLLHEKPFDGVNGSGKHNNWSISTNTGANLLEPGDTPSENAQFLLFLCAVIKAVDDYQDLLRVSIASAGNDHRLGAQEAPPAIVSMFLGEELTEILESIEKGEDYEGSKEKELLKVGVHVLPRFPKDTTDRNRTSPFAFTGNKFEFRMLGSSASVAGPNTTLNTAVAEVLSQFADELESAQDFESALHNLIRRVIKNHKRIIFNGNGYDDAWVEEAKRRGLLNLRTTPECLPYMLHDKNIELYKKHKVYSEAEIKAHYEIKNEKYCKYLNIEVLTMIDMTKKDILPCVSRQIHELSDTLIAKKNAIAGIDTSYEETVITKLSVLTKTAFDVVRQLEENSKIVKTIDESDAASFYYKNNIIPLMVELRNAVDEMETLCPSDKWCYPSYGDLLFSVK
jgi:glutamine synthetase